MPIATTKQTAMEEPDDNKNKGVNKDTIDKLIKSTIDEAIVSNDEPLTAEEATRFLGYKDVHVVLNLIKNGSLRAHRVGRKRWLIWKSDLIAYVNAH